MSVDERRHRELFRRLAGSVGEEAAMTMFELLPPPETELATASDIAVLAERSESLEATMAARFGAVDHRFGTVDQRFDAVGQRFDAMDQRFDAVDQRFDAVDERFDAMDRRFDAVDQRFGALGQRLEQRMDASIDTLRYELLAAFRGELVSAVAGQTRALIVATATATFGIGGLAVTLAQLL